MTGSEMTVINHSSIVLVFNMEGVVNSSGVGPLYPPNGSGLVVDFKIYEYSRIKILAAFSHEIHQFL